LHGGERQLVELALKVGCLIDKGRVDVGKKLRDVVLGGADLALILVEALETKCT
jgi:hypothetical protein